MRPFVVDNAVIMGKKKKHGVGLQYSFYFLKNEQSMPNRVHFRPGLKNHVILLQSPIQLGLDESIVVGCIFTVKTDDDI